MNHIKAEELEKKVSDLDTRIEAIENWINNFRGQEKDKQYSKLEEYEKEIRKGMELGYYSLAKGADKFQRKLDDLIKTLEMKSEEGRKKYERR